MHLNRSQSSGAIGAFIAFYIFYSLYTFAAVGSYGVTWWLSCWCPRKRLGVSAKAGCSWSRPRWLALIRIQGPTDLCSVHVGAGRCRHGCRASPSGTDNSISRYRVARPRTSVALMSLPSSYQWGTKARNRHKSCTETASVRSKATCIAIETPPVDYLGARR